MLNYDRHYSYAGMSSGASSGRSGCGTAGGAVVGTGSGYHTGSIGSRGRHGSGAIGVISIGFGSLSLGILSSSRLSLF